MVLGGGGMVARLVFGLGLFVVVRLLFVVTGVWIRAVISFLA